MKELTEEQRELRREAGRKGGLARAKQFTSASQRAARRKVSSASCAANGAKGAQVTLARHGFEKLFERARQHRLKHPSQNELLVIGVLAQLQIANEREWQIGNSMFTCDFYLPLQRKVIEVRGRVHQVFDVEKRARRTAQKMELLAALRIPVLWIEAEELADLVAVIARIRAFLA